jgi:hypothetical protein
MKWFRRTLIIAVVVGFIILSKDPLGDVAGFIIGGLIPGTNISLGFWPSILLVLLLVHWVYIWVKSLHFEMLESIARDATNKTLFERNAEIQSDDKDINKIYKNSLNGGSIFEHNESI